MKPVLVDTCIWIRHFRERNVQLAAMLEDGDVWCHPVIIGELAMVPLKSRKQTLSDLECLNRPPIASCSETRKMVEARQLWGSGIQWNDAKILASAILGEIPLWTSDRRLGEIAADLGFGFA